MTIAYLPGEAGRSFHLMVNPPPKPTRGPRKKAAAQPERVAAGKRGPGRPKKTQPQPAEPIAEEAESPVTG